jgi:roadblock/LC7 domain-containing protein
MRIIMASTLKDLLDLKGVVAAGEFSRDGSLVDFEASVDFPENLAQTTAQFTAAVTQLFDVLAGSFTKLNPQFAFAPQQGWAYSGGEWSVAVGGTRGVFVRTADADYNELFGQLVGPR